MKILSLIVSLFAADAVLAQNLFVNPDLDEGPASWVLGCGTDLSWIAEDEAQCPGSGALHVTSGTCQFGVGAGAGQCVAVAGLSQVSATGRVRATGGLALVVLLFFSGPDCAGNQLHSLLQPFPGTPGQWQTVSVEGIAVPVGTDSILAGFGAAAGGSPVDADVDAGYAGARPLVFRDGFEGDDPGVTAGCRWDVALP